LKNFKIKGKNPDSPDKGVSHSYDGVDLGAAGTSSLDLENFSILTREKNNTRSRKEAYGALPR